MADSELKDLNEDTTPSTDDIVYVVDDPTGSPTDKKVTLANLLTGMKGIKSDPPSNCYTISNIYLDASLRIVVVYNDVAIP